MDLFPGNKVEEEREINHSPPIFIKITNAWSFSPQTHIGIRVAYAKQMNGDFTNYLHDQTFVGL
jgi:hypothetical protein